MDVTPAEVRLHLDELVLHGFAPADRHRIGDAVYAELSRLLAERVPPRLLADAQAGSAALDAGAFQVPRGAAPAAVGARVAQALYRALGG